MVIFQGTFFKRHGLLIYGGDTEARADIISTSESSVVTFI